MQRGKIYRLKNNAILQKGRDEKQYKRCKNGNSILLLSIRENNDEYTVYAEIIEKEVKNSMKMTFDRKCYWVRFSEFITLSNNAVELTDHFLYNSYGFIRKLNDRRKRWKEVRRRELSKKKNAEREIESLLRQSRHHRDKYGGTRVQITIPKTVQWNAVHPYSGGSIRPR